MSVFLFCIPCCVRRGWHRAAGGLQDCGGWQAAPQQVLSAVFWGLVEEQWQRAGDTGALCWSWALLPGCWGQQVPVQSPGEAVGGLGLSPSQKFPGLLLCFAVPMGMELLVQSAVVGLLPC